MGELARSAGGGTRADYALLHRRDLIGGALAASGALATTPVWAANVSDQFKAIEARTGGRLGLWAGRQGGAVVEWRARERFLMCSTFKALAVSAVLARVDHGAEKLDRWVPYGRKDLLSYAPTTSAHVDQGGMTLEGLCGAAVSLSDNTAANLILASLGGPAGVTRYLRALGDQTTRLDRNEPSLNDPAPNGAPLDTTTPFSMTRLWRRLLLGDALSPASRARLNGWLEAATTGPKRLPTIVPKGWKLGHKTGSGPTTIGDVGILTPPGRPPILIAAYLDTPGTSDNTHDDAIAEAARVALGVIAPDARPA
jgi:beta-lactamase class A